MRKSKNLWLLLGTAVAGLALLLALAVTLVQVTPGDLVTGTPVPTEVAWGAASPFADTVTAHPGMAPHERLEVPAMSDPPTQIEIGHLEYWMSCMVCHGDRGQGLTEEWRTVLDPMDMNCWQSKCHAANHPPEGFQLPRTSPMIIGPGALTGYETAQDLFEYLKATMPWPFPGLFQDVQYWGLTAYLLDANGVDLGKPLANDEKCEGCEDGGNCDCQRVKEELGPENAADILVAPGLVQTHKTAFETEQIAAVVVVGLLLCAAVVFWVIRAL
jgi:mono/diheme cytochrome c family protein